MQTFLPYPSFTKSAQVLDRQRLGKQRVEVLQILKAILDPGYGWQSHPAVLMWRGYEIALAAYGRAICNEWIERGYRDTCKDKISRLALSSITDKVVWHNPPWIGNPDFHASHRSALLAKNPEWYSQFEWVEEAKIDYVWPT